MSLHPIAKPAENLTLPPLEPLMAVSPELPATPSIQDELGFSLSETTEPAGRLHRSSKLAGGVKRIVGRQSSLKFGQPVELAESVPDTLGSHLVPIEVTAPQRSTADLVPVRVPAKADRAVTLALVDINATRTISVPIKLPIIDAEPVAVVAVAEPTAPKSDPQPIITKAPTKPVANKPSVTVRHTGKSKTPVVPEASKSYRKVTATKPVTKEGSHKREAISTTNVLLLGGLALVAAKAYRKDQWQKVRDHRSNLSLAGASGTVTRFKDSLTNKVQDTNWRDAPLQVMTRSRIRLMELNEKGHEHKGVLAGAIGTVLLAGIAVAAYKGLHHGGDPTTFAGSEHVPGTGSGVATHGHNLAAVSPPKQLPHTTGGAALHHSVPAPHEVAAHGEAVTIHHGDGFTDAIDSYAKQHHVQLTGGQEYRLYQQLHAHLGNNILDTNTFQLPNGDLGISHAGNAHWNPQAQHIIEGFLKAAKKKKTLS